MSKGQSALRPDGDVKDVIRLLLAERPSISTGDVVAATGLTRQAVHYHLSEMTRTGQLVRTGAGRGTRYRRHTRFSRTYSLAGLAEDRVWEEVRESVPEVAGSSENVRSVLGYAFTEMLNNAIEHSGGTEARVTWWVEPESIVFEIADDGDGLFVHVRQRLRLPDDFAVIQELSKGKLTTDPEHHTGEGIFFTSRVLDRFELHSGDLRWIVDNVRGDQAVGEVPRRRGTRIRGDLSRTTERTLQGVFDAHADPETFAFTRSSVVVPLFQSGDRFLSRSEARRISHRLEAFDEVVLDFSGVQEVGQGFVDELFRVWAREHPATRLVPVKMSGAVERMVRRGLPGEAPRRSPD
jgi:anti-sigma regulatory factor (Ser/Thr protein kinase)